MIYKIKVLVTHPLFFHLMGIYETFIHIDHYVASRDGGLYKTLLRGRLKTHHTMF